MELFFLVCPHQLPAEDHQMLILIDSDYNLARSAAWELADLFSAAAQPIIDAEGQPEATPNEITQKIIAGLEPIKTAQEGTRCLHDWLARVNTTPEAASEIVIQAVKENSDSIGCLCFDFNRDKNLKPGYSSFVRRLFCEDVLSDVGPQLGFPT
jgi:hypothetical protein